MQSVVRGADGEVFETPDLTEDDALESSTLASGAEGRADPSGRSVNKVPEGEVILSTMPPRTAFEVFMGKTYAGAREDMSDAIGASANGAVASDAVYSGDGYRREATDHGVAAEGGASMREAETHRGRTGESPVERLVRLREETALLAEDLEEMAKARSSDVGEGGEGEGRAGQSDADGGEDGEAGDGYALWCAMAKETDNLRRQLALLSKDPKYQHIVSPGPPTAAVERALQQRLSMGVANALEGLRDPGLKTDPDGEGSVKDPAVAGDDAEGRSDSVTFELFLKEASEARRRFGARPRLEGGLSETEARIAALEKALGGRGGSASGDVGEVGRPLAEVVASLESRVALLEPGRLENVRQKAQLARAELEALSKARSSVAGSSAGSPGSPSGAGRLTTTARNKKLEEAFNTLQTWQAVAAGLPTLVDRLRTLETLHLASASFAQRLEQLEAAQADLGGALTRTAEAVEATRSSAAENVTIVNENIRALDSRLAGVGV